MIYVTQPHEDNDMWFYYSGLHALKDKVPRTAIALLHASHEPRSV